MISEHARLDMWLSYLSERRDAQATATHKFADKPNQQQHHNDGKDKLNRALRYGDADNSQRPRYDVVPEADHQDDQGEVEKGEQDGHDRKRTPSLQVPQITANDIGLHRPWDFWKPKHYKRRWIDDV